MNMILHTSHLSQRPVSHLISSIESFKENTNILTEQEDELELRQQIFLRFFSLEENKLKQFFRLQSKETELQHLLQIERCPQVVGQCPLEYVMTPSSVSSHYSKLWGQALCPLASCPGLVDMLLCCCLVLCALSQPWGLPLCHSHIILQEAQRPQSLPVSEMTT